VAAQLKEDTMDLMLLGETVRASAGGQSFHGYWMPAGGNDGVAGCEVFFTTAGTAMTVHLETKSSDQADSSATSIGSVSIASAGAATYKFDVANALDLVRYRLTSSRDATIHLQYAQPLWNPN
jgi:hypothetical protein